MPTYIRLAQLTESGVRNVSRVDEMLAEARRVFEANGCELKQAWATLGPYDFVAVVEAPTDKIMMKASAEVASAGNFRAVTMSAVAAAEFASAVRARTGPG